MAVSARTAEYLRVMLTPKDEHGAHRDQHASIAALSRNAVHLWEVLSNLAYHDDNTARDHAVSCLAKRMKVTPATVRRARAELVAAGLVTVDGGGSGSQKDVNRYRFPLGAPVEVVHTPRASARGTSSTPRASAREDPARQRAIRDPLDPLVTDTYAVQRGAEPWRQIIERAIAADDARRAGGT
jgi:DNA-binding transcriptional ArsR family regulator